MKGCAFQNNAYIYSANYIRSKKHKIKMNFDNSLHYEILGEIYIRIGYPSYLLDYVTLN